MTEQAPLSETLDFTNPGATIAADDSFPLGEVPFAGTVTGVTYTPDATITGAATNHRAIRVRNKGAAGSGTTVIAELAFDNGVNATAFDEKTIPLTATAADLVVAQGDVLELFTDAIGTGIVDPGGLVQVTIARS